jgi:hypothetical protein
MLRSCCVSCCQNVQSHVQSTLLRAKKVLKGYKAQCALGIDEVMKLQDYLQACSKSHSQREEMLIFPISKNTIERSLNKKNKSCRTVF